MNAAALLRAGIWAYALALYVFLGLRSLISGQSWVIAFLSNFTLFGFIPLVGALPAAVALRAARLVWWLLPLCALGALWTARYWVGKDQQRAVVPLTVMTFNLWTDNRELERLTAWLRQTRPDIVLLQETPTAWSAGVPALADVYPYSAAQPRRRAEGTHTLLSRYPVVSVTSFRLTDEDIFRQQRAVIDVDGRLIAVYNVHFFPLKGDAPRVVIRPYSLLVNTVLAYDERIRRAQVAALVARLAEEPLPYIVGGDFNFSDQNPLYDSLSAAMTDSFMSAGVGFGWTWRSRAGDATTAAIPTLIRLDYLWHRRDLRTAAAWVGPALGSDHLPVLAVLDIEPISP